MRNVSELFALWPSDADLGRDIGVAYPTVSAWKQRGSIPSAYWRDVVRAAQRRGHMEGTAELLAELHARKTAKQATEGLGEEQAVTTRLEGPIPAQAPESHSTEMGHFSRWKHLRRGDFASSEAIAAHVDALRDEWDRR